MCVEKEKTMQKQRSEKPKTMRNIKSAQPRAMQKLYALTEKRSIDLSLSENPLGCSPRVVSALENTDPKLNSYPAANGGLLKQKLANKFLLDADNFFIANGSEAIINSLPQVFGKDQDEVIIPALTFPMFAVSSRLAGKVVVNAKMTHDLGISLDKMAKLVTKKTRMVFICNPNNPTGSVLAIEEILQFIENIPEKILVVVDEANVEFGGESVIKDTAVRDNLIVLRSFSKGYGLAALRVGFAASSKGIIKKLEQETPLFPVSGLSEKLASIALDDDQFLKTTKKFTAGQRNLLTSGLKKLGFRVFPSETNNLFVKAPEFIKSKPLAKKLKEKDISVIMGSSFESCDDSFFRASVRDEKTNLLFLERMEEVAD